MADDLNVQPQPDDPVPAAPAEPPAPDIDLDAAYRVVADNEGWDPRLARFEMQELKRRKEEQDRREREWEQRARAPEPRLDPTPDFGGDQYAKMAYEAKQEASEVKRLILEDREEKRKEREKNDLIEALGGELDSSYKALARQNGMTNDQIKAQSEEFFALLTDIYPEPEMLSRLGSERAVRNTFRIMRGGNGGYSPPPRNPYRDPRAVLTIPTGTSGASAPSQNGDDMQMRPGETQEQYDARMKAWWTGKKFNDIVPEGGRISSG